MLYVLLLADHFFKNTSSFFFFFFFGAEHWQIRWYIWVGGFGLSKRDRLNRARASCVTTFAWPSPTPSRQIGLGPRWAKKEPAWATCSQLCGPVRQTGQQNGAHQKQPERDHMMMTSRSCSSVPVPVPLLLALPGGMERLPIKEDRQAGPRPIQGRKESSRS